MESPIFAKSEEMLSRVFGATESFPRRVRGSLCRMIEVHALKLDGHLTLAAFEERERNRKGWLAELRLADRRKATLSRMLRVAREQGHLSFKNYERISEVLGQVGKLIGGWKKRGMPETQN